jgi:hypothetical protein
VYERDHADAEYQVPDVMSYRLDGPVPARLTGAAVELVAEVSPANRRQRDDESAVVGRATRYGIDWVLIVDPAVGSARWWHRGDDVAAGPAWTAGLDLDAVLTG